MAAAFPPTSTLRRRCGGPGCLAAFLDGTMLFQIGKDGSQVSALEAPEQIEQDPAPPPDAFQGYQIPPVTDTYTLVTKADSPPADVMLDGQAIPLSVHSGDDEPPDVWASQPLH